MRGMIQSDPRGLRRLCPRRLARWRGLRGEGGNALIELALVFSLLGIPLLLGTVELGSVGYDSVEISDAANAGVLYGMQDPAYAANTSGITTAAQANASDFGANLTVTPYTYYACTTAVGGTQYPTASYTQNQATAKCTGSGDQALEFIQVQTSATVTPSIRFPGLPKTFTLNGSAVMEVEQ